LSEDVEGDFVIPNPEEKNEEGNEGETTPSNDKPSFDIPTGRSKAKPEESGENDDEAPKNSGRKKSVYLENVVNKTLIDILEDLKEINSISYQKDVKRTAERIGKNVMFLNETLKGNL